MEALGLRRRGKPEKRVLVGAVAVGPEAGEWLGHPLRQHEAWLAVLP